MQPNAWQKNLPLSYFVLTFVLALPFWWFGGEKLPLPINLPVGALVTFVPMIAAAILCYRRSGFTGVKEFFKKVGDYAKIRPRAWYLPALLLAPAIYGLSYAVMRWTGLPLPEPINFPLLMVPVFFVMFFLGGVGEELGWSGYAVDPLQERWGAITAGFIVGMVWAIWHAIPFVQTGNAPDWIVWQSLKTIAMRLLIVWLYNKTGKSVLVATLYHAADNASWALFPNFGSHYNPFVTAMLTWLTAGIVLFAWGQRAERESVKSHV
jgi:membrane protease YdiL (CAAX protease family)